MSAREERPAAYFPRWFSRWVARFMLAVDETLPLGWFNMTPEERRWWIGRAR